MLGQINTKCRILRDLIKFTTVSLQYLRSAAMLQQASKSGQMRLSAIAANPTYSFRLQMHHSKNNLLFDSCKIFTPFKLAPSVSCNPDSIWMKTMSAESKYFHILENTYASKSFIYVYMAWVMMNANIKNTLYYHWPSNLSTSYSIDRLKL